jgi:peptidoglycan hydrolase-like amidase
MQKTSAIVSVLLLSSFALAQEVHIGVLSLFHPRELVVAAPLGSALLVHAGGESFTLENSSGEGSVHLEASSGGVVVRCGSHMLRSQAVSILSRQDGPIELLLTVPGKLTRRYRGKLGISQASGILIPVVSMDLESAVASAVAAESLATEPLEALKAQAVAARSYFLAGAGRHRNFDFCDTTHCQFLRQSPEPDEAAAKAARFTQGLIIRYRSHPVATMYTRSCGRRTRTPAEIGLPTADYPYYSVKCRYCRQHPSRWHSSIPANDATELRTSDERSRLMLNRRLGWNTVQSNDFTVKSQSAQMVIEGVGQGHGIGLCQAGSRAMAEEGADFRQILAHYYPNTEIIRID